MTHKINIHAHSHFSDGGNSPYHMALKAKELGFTALVITDHFYGEGRYASLTKKSMRLLKKACREAGNILPIIIGIEVPFMGQEILVFGRDAINDILLNGKLTMDRLLSIKKETECATILCHPGNNFDLTIPAIDGFEQYNHGRNYFKNNRDLGGLKDLPRWCNSDAHTSDALGIGYNIVDKKIETETDLIQYIKSGKQPIFNRHF